VDTHRGLILAAVGAGLPAKRPALLANFTRRSPLPPLPYSRVNPLLHLIGVDTHRGLILAAVGAGLPAKSRPCWPIFTRRSPLPPLPYSRVNPLLPGALLAGSCARHVIARKRAWLKTCAVDAAYACQARCSCIRASCRSSIDGYGSISRSTQRGAFGAGDRADTRTLANQGVIADLPLHQQQVAAVLRQCQGILGLSVISRSTRSSPCRSLPRPGPAAVAG
jgi:hypothetical protein